MAWIAAVRGLFERLLEARLEAGPDAVRVRVTERP